MNKERNVYRDILKFGDHQACSVTVDASKVEPDERGRKILPAGTIIGGVTNAVIADGGNLVEDKNTSGKITQAEGILHYDVDVTEGNALGAMIFVGSIDKSALPQEPVAGFEEAMPHLVFFAK